MNIAGLALPTALLTLTRVARSPKGAATVVAVTWGLLGASCENGEQRGPATVGSSGASASAGSSEDQAAARAALEKELRPIVRAELRAELMPQVRAELRSELGGAGAGSSDSGSAGRSPRPPQPGSDDPDARGANEPEVLGGPSAPGQDADIWSSPGSKIWPSSGGFRLVELVVGTTLEDKLPVDIRTHYPNVPEILYCYTVFENPDSDTNVTHIWRRGSRLVSRVELEVGKSPKWRTWSKQRTQPHWTGLWSCEVLGPDGQQLGLTVFQIGG